MEVLKEEGDWRLSLGVDEYPEKPYDEGGWPVLRIYSRFSDDVTHVDNSAAPLDEQKESAERAVRHWHTKPSDSDWKLFEKWLRAYLGVTRIETYYSGESWYVAYDSAAWREWAGVSPEQTATEDPLAEIRAWVEGEVYFYALEKRVTWHADGYPEYPDRQTWETVESCGGLYGSKWAEQAALEAWGCRGESRS